MNQKRDCFSPFLIGETAQKLTTASFRARTPQTKGERKHLRGGYGKPKSLLHVWQIWLEDDIHHEQPSPARLSPARAFLPDTRVRFRTSSNLFGSAQFCRHRRLLRQLSQHDGTGRGRENLRNYHQRWREWRWYRFRD